MSKKIILIILALLLVVGLFFMLSGGEETEGGGNTQTEATVDKSFVEILNFDYKKNVFGKWVVSGHLKNSSAYAIDQIEFAVKFSDNTEFIMFEDGLSAGAESEAFELKLTGHKGEELLALTIREVFAEAK